MRLEMRGIRGMILLLGASGYIGQAFASELRRRRCAFIALTRLAIDYTQFDLLFDYVRKMNPAFIINAAGYTGKPTVDACELDREETLYGNTLLPQTIARVCLITNAPWGHVSSGCIYSGAKVIKNGEMRVERDLSRPELKRLFVEHPEKFYGFTELDPQNFSFLCPPCSFHSGTKALAEEAICGVGQNYIWRPRITYSECDDPRNFLSKIQRYPKVYDNVNSISHLEDFVRACLDLWKDDEEFYRLGARAPRSNCILDVSKLLATGVSVRPVQEALEDSLQRWSAVTAAPRLVYSE